MQYGTRVTSATRTGSQNPIGIPGSLPLHKQMRSLEFGVSLIPPRLMVAGPIDIGNKHFQHTSVIGFMNFPLQFEAFAVLKMHKITIDINAVLI